VKVALRSTANYYSALLQQIPVNVRPRYTSVERKTNPDKLPESTRVVVPLSLRITECLKDRICLENLSLEQAQATLGASGAVRRNMSNFCMERASSGQTRRWGCGE
jgi:hypothetical protein